MLKPDGTYFRLFYRSPLGQFVAEQVQGKLQETLASWQKMRSEGDKATWVMVGYPFPLLSPAALDHVHIVVPFGMTISSIHKVFHSHTTIHQSPELPFEDHAVAGVVLYHALEFADQPKHALEELWRVLEPSGRVLLMVPHRKSPWAHKDSTPFGHGLPYTESQLSSLLDEQGFTVLSRDYHLPLPPRHAQFWVRIQRKMLRCLQNYCALARLQKWGWVKGGVLMIEAEKRLYAVTPDPVSKSRKVFQPHVEPELARRSKSS